MDKCDARGSGTQSFLYSVNSPWPMIQLTLRLFSLVVDGRTALRAAKPGYGMALAGQTSHRAPQTLAR